MNSPSSIASPIEQALKSAQKELSTNPGGKDRHRVDTPIHKEGQVKDTEESKQLDNNGIEVSHDDFQKYYTRHQQPKNEIPYSDWMHLFPNLDLINGNFTCDDANPGVNDPYTIKPRDETFREPDETSANNSIQVPEEFKEIIECRNKLKKLILDKLMVDDIVQLHNSY